MQISQQSLPTVSQMDQKQLPSNQQEPSPKQLLTKKQYIIHLLTQISKAPQLHTLLYRPLFKDLSKYVNQFYLNDWNKIVLIRVLEDYIKYSLSNVVQRTEVSDWGATDTRYGDLEKFGKLFGADVARVLGEVRSFRGWVADSLAYLQRYSKYQFSPKSDYMAQLKSLIDDITPFCQKQILSSFYLYSYLLKLCKNMQKQQPAFQINQKLIQILSQLKKQYRPKYVNKNPLKSVQTYQVRIIKLDGSPEQKYKQASQDIIKIVDQTKKNIVLFSEIFNQACIRNQCVGLKFVLRPVSKDGGPVLERLIERLVEDRLKKEYKCIEDQLKATKTLDQYIQQQQILLKELTTKIIGEKQQLNFIISDILVAKSIFPSIQSANKAYTTLQKMINKFNQQKQAENRIIIVEMEDRLSYSDKDIFVRIGINGIVYQVFFMVKVNRFKTDMWVKFDEILGYSYLSPLLQITEWNERMLKNYIGILQSENILSINESQKQKQKQKMSRLLSFLDMKNKFTISKPRQQKNKDSALINHMLNHSNTKIDKTRLQQAEVYKKLCTLQYLFQLSQYQQVINIKDHEQLANCKGEAPAEGSSLDSKNKYALLCANEQFQIGLTYYMLQKHSEALYYYGRCLSKRETVFGKEHAQCASVLNNMGLVHKAMNNKTDALYYLQQALKIKQKLKGKQTPDYALTLLNIAIINKTTQNYSQAISKLLTCLQIYQNLNQSEQQQQKQKRTTLQTANTLQNLGYCCEKTQKYVQALKYYGRALELKEGYRGEYNGECSALLNTIKGLYGKLGLVNRMDGQWRHLRYYMILQDIATYYKIGKDYKSAIQHYQQQLNQLQAQKLAPGPQKSFKATQIKTLNSLSETFYESGNFLQAVQYSEKSLLSVKEECGTQSQSYVDQLSNIGLAYMGLGQYGKAIEVLKECLQVGDKEHEVQTARVLPVLNSIGLAYYKTKDYQQAQKNYEQCQKIAASTNGKQSLQYARILNNKGLILRKNKKYQQAMKCFTQSLRIMGNTNKIGTLEYGFVLNNMGSVYFYLKQFYLAIQYYNKSLAIKEKFKGKDSREYKDTLDNIQAARRILESIKQA